jgi:UDP-N-acetylmuramate dehydrogenase
LTRLLSSDIFFVEIFSNTFSGSQNMQNNKKELLSFLKTRFAGDYLQNEPLSLHTWYRIGGPADFFVYPKNLEDLIHLLRWCRQLDYETFFIGEGANVLASDSGFKGVMISLSRYMNQIRLENGLVHADSGALLKSLIIFSEKKQLGGLQGLSGIPGTVGGALFMNAGTYTGEIGGSVLDVDVLNSDDTVSAIPRSEIDFNYRHVPQLRDKVILGCRLKLYREKESVLRDFRIEQLRKRNEKQPVDCPSCGSVFKRPGKKLYVGKMVEELGLKGLRFGDAMISEKHGGFIINLGSAKAADVMYLIRKIMADVKKNYQVELEPEVRFVGF